MIFVLHLFNPIQRVHVLLDDFLCRAPHLAHEDSEANSQKDEEQEEHTDDGEEESFLLIA